MPIMTRANTPQFFKQHSQSLEEQELTKPTIGVAIIDNIIIVNTCMTVWQTLADFCKDISLS